MKNKLLHKRFIWIALVCLANFVGCGGGGGGGSSSEIEGNKSNSATSAQATTTSSTANKIG